MYKYVRVSVCVRKSSAVSVTILSLFNLMCCVVYCAATECQICTLYGDLNSRAEDKNEKKRLVSDGGLVFSADFVRDLL